MNATGTRMLHTHSCWWREDTKPTNQRILINNQHTLLIMNEYHSVASLTAIQSGYGNEKLADFERCLRFAVPFQVLLFVSISKNCLITELSWLDLEDALGKRYPKSSLNRKKPWTEPILWRNFSQETSSLSKFWLDLQIPQIQYNQVLHDVVEPRTIYKDHLSFPTHRPAGQAMAEQPIQNQYDWFSTFTVTTHLFVVEWLLVWRDKYPAELDLEVPVFPGLLY